MNNKNTNKKHHQHNQDVHEEHHEQYYCPMKCEGEKVYNRPGNCPVCNMKLAPVSDTGSHDHQHHGCC